MSNDTSPAIASDLQRLLASDSTESSSEYGYDAFDEDDPLSWFPEPDLGRDWEAICSSKKVKKDLENAMKELPMEITPSEFTAFAFRMPKQHGYGYERFSFEGRRHMFAIYNTSAQRVLLCCARQTEKSTTLGNITLNYSCLIPAFKTLYVSPSAMQTKVFSNDRIKEPIETSPILKTFTNRVLAQNVFEKQFINRSKVTLRYSFLNADRTRGIPAYMLLLDEIQDLLAENIPVIERCTDHAPDHYKRFIYSGTPKSLDNTIENYRSRFARQGEWVVPCERCGGGDYKYWNILGEQNIGKHGLICAKCGKLINPQHPEAQWAFMVDDAPFESYRVNGLMVPWKKWSEIIFDYETNSRAKFFNEVLGLSYDSGTRPLTLKQVRDCCKEHISMHPKDLRKYYTSGYDKPVFMGIDYGCYSEDTRTLTENGWKYHWEIAEGERIAQYDPHTEEISYVVPLRKIVFEHVGNMVRFKTNNQDLLVTPDHKMFYRTGTKKAPWREGQAQELLGKHNVRFRKVGKWQGTTPKYFTLPVTTRLDTHRSVGGQQIPTDLWMKFLGIIIAEGGVCESNGRLAFVSVIQRNVCPEKVKYIATVMQQMSMYLNIGTYHYDVTDDYQWKIYGKELWEWYAANIGKDSELKRIPREFMAYGQDALRQLFEALVLGDGSVDPRCIDNFAYYSTSRGLVEDVAELATKLEYKVTWGLHKKAEGNHQAMYRTGISANREATIHKDKITLEPYSGKAYCFSVPSGYFVTERNGRVAFQGNTGENSYTIITIGTYVDSKFRIIYMERCIGEMMEPERQVEHIIELANRYKVTRIGADYGGGYDRNDKLTRTFGTTRIIKFQYMARARKKIEWDPRLMRFKVQRTEVMSDIFNAIKRNQFEFPRWAEFESPFAMDMLNIFSEYNEQLRQIQYKHSVDKPDDSFHSLLYCFLASMTVIPRPDVIAPRRQINHEQAIFGNPYTGPTDQGRETIL